MEQTRSLWRRFGALTFGILAGGAIAAPAAWAHTGGRMSGTVDGLVHPLTGVDHLLAMLAVGIIAATAKDRRIALATPAAFLAGMLGGGVLGLLGVQVPATEIAVAVSVVVLGVLVVSTSHSSGWWLPVLAAAFGAVHGHAHGAELPTGAAPVAYVAGFIGASAALHASGTAFGLFMRRLPSVRVATGAMLATVGVALLVGI